MNRWIIRSFFIGLLLLFLNGWVWSYQGEIDVSVFELQRGQIRMWIPCDPAPFPWFAGRTCDFLGFGFGSTDDDQMIIAIPFWFMTMLSTGWLYLAWRHTRTMTRRERSFPALLNAQARAV